MSAAGNITVSALTDRGRERVRNEDSILADAASGVVILADGLGGHRAGEVASALAVALTMNKSCRGEQMRTAGAHTARPG